MRKLRTPIDAITAKQLINKWQESDIRQSMMELERIYKMCHAISVVNGCWFDGKGQFEDRNFGEIMAHMHSTVSKVMEAGSKNLPNKQGSLLSELEIELADLLIEIFDLAFVAAPNLGAAFASKCLRNLSRKNQPNVKQLGKAL